MSIQILRPARHLVTVPAQLARHLVTPVYYLNVCCPSRIPYNPYSLASYLIRLSPRKMEDDSLVFQNTRLSRFFCETE